MRIFVIGGTGLVGSYLLPKLVDAGHDLCVLTRSTAKIQKIERLGAIGILGDIRYPQEFRKHIKNIDIIVLLAMPSVKPGKRVSKKMKEELKKETNCFFRNSIDMAIQYNALLILPSGTSFHTKNNEIADETWPIRRVGLTEIGKDTDELVNEAIRTNNPKIIQLLYGKIYGNGGLFLFMHKMMKKGRFKIIGNGDNYIPNIHANDAASAIVKVIEKMPIGEKFIIADDFPVTQKEFAFYMADLMDVKQPGKIPGFIIKMVLGKDMYKIITMNCKVSNHKAKELLDWQPQFPTYKEGLKETIREINSKRNYFA